MFEQSEIVQRAAGSGSSEERRVEALDDAARTRFGFVALVGCPNAGKSTLMNACIGQKVAGVSAKPQTTRNRIVGLIQGEQTQIALLDTPGFIAGADARRSNRLFSYMNREAWGALNGADLICYLVDATRGLIARDEEILKELLEKFGSKLRLVLTKSDKLPREFHRDVILSVKNALQNLSENTIPVDIISAKVPTEVERFIERISKLMPAGPFHYSTDRVTDRDTSFICSELLREQVFRCLGQELPYGAGVLIEKIDRSRPDLRSIAATILVPKSAHKGMIIGRGGSKLKEIGTKARAALESHFGCRVFLEVFVKVDPGWATSDASVVEVQGPASDAL